MRSSFLGRPLDRATAGAAAKLALFVVVTVTATASLAVTIAGVGLGDTHEYKAVFTDATGAEKGDDVRIAGVRVGEVRDIAVRTGEDGRALAELTFTVDADQTLGQGTITHCGSATSSASGTSP